jgi:hypothetical protein
VDYGHGQMEDGLHIARFQNFKKVGIKESKKFKKKPHEVNDLSTHV